MKVTPDRKDLDSENDISIKWECVWLAIFILAGIVVLVLFLKLNGTV